MERERERERKKEREIGRDSSQMLARKRSQSIEKSVKEIIK